MVQGNTKSHETRTGSDFQVQNYTKYTIYAYSCHNNDFLVPFWAITTLYKILMVFLYLVHTVFDYVVLTPHPLPEMVSWCHHYP